MRWKMGDADGRGRAILGVWGIGVICICGCRGEEKKTIPPPAVTVMRPVRQTVTEFYEYTGTTAAVATVDLRARVKGFLEKMLFEPKAKVKKDQLLFLIDPREYEASLEKAKAELAARKANLQFTEYDVTRLKELASKDVAAEYELKQGIAKRDAAAASVQGADASIKEAQLRVDFTRVTTPISGRVSRNFVDVGNLVGANGDTLLATVVDDSRIYVYFTVSERDILTLRRKYPSTQPDKPLEASSVSAMPVFMALADETGYPHRGYVDYWDPYVDPATGTLKVRAVFDNAKGLMFAGLFARVRIPVDRYEAWLVPEESLGFDQSGSYVLVVNDRDEVDRLSVTMGITQDAMRAIPKGLTGRERVIVKGLQRARPGSRVSPKWDTSMSAATTRRATTRATQ